MNYSIQLYGLRDITGSNMDEALKSVAEIGYSSVEFAGFFGHPAEEIKDMLDKYGISVSGTHTGIGELVNDFGGTVAYHKIIGNKSIIIPGFDYSTKEKLDAFVRDVNEVQPKLAEQGINMFYHNHSGEFITTDYGVRVFDYLCENTSLGLEIDTFWAFHAGLDPVKLMSNLGKRVGFIHIKDGLANGEGKPLGKGEAPVRAVYEYGTANGITLCVESETLSPSGKEEARLCFECLRSFEK